MDDEIFLGDRHTYGGFSAAYSLPLSQLSRHAHVIGKSGTGKSTLLQILIQSLVQLDHGICVVDPHGELAEWTLKAIPSSRLSDVIYLNFADEEFAPSLNFVSDSVPIEARPRLASALVSAFRHIWFASWGPRLEHILYHALRVLIDCQNTSLVALPRLLTDDAYRTWAVAQCHDPFIQAFWSQEYDVWDRRFRSDAIAPVLNKLGQLAAFPPLRETLGQVKMKVNVPDILDNGKILVVNLAKGSMGEDASKLLGALLTSAIAAAAMERSTSPSSGRRESTLFLDEAHCFLSEAMATVLSESRKFGLRLVLAHQFLDQLSPIMKEAVLANAGSTFVFRVSGADANVLSENFGHSTSPDLLVELPPFTCLLRPAEGWIRPFKFSITPPRMSQKSHFNSIAARSRQFYCTPRTTVEEKLRRWLAKDDRWQ